VAIAQEVRNLDTSSESLFLIEGHGHDIPESAGFPTVNMSTVEEAWSSWDFLKRKRFQAEFYRELLCSYRPQLILFDCIPSNILFDAVVENGIPFAICVRKCKDMPFYYQCNHEALSVATRLLIAHDPDEVSIPDELRDRAVFVGRIVRRWTGQLYSRENDRSKLLVITGGGGGYPNTVEFYNLALQAFQILSDTADWRAVLIAGPLFRDWLSLQHVSGARVAPFLPDVQSLFAIADVVVCQAGYNTVAEILETGARAVAVPAPRWLDDQYHRAASVSAVHTGFKVFSGGDASLLANAIASLAAEPGPVGRPGAAPNGATLAAETLLQLAVGGDQSGLTIAAPSDGNRVSKVSR